MSFSPARQSNEVVGQQAAPGSDTRYFHPSWCHWLLLLSLVMLGDRIAGLATYNDLLCSCLAQAKIVFPAPTRHGFICVSGCFWMAPINRRGVVVRGRAESGLSGTFTSPSRWRPCSWPVFCNQFVPQLWFWEPPLGLLSLSPWECFAFFLLVVLLLFKPTLLFPLVLLQGNFPCKAQILQHPTTFCQGL